MSRAYEEAWAAHRIEIRKDSQLKSWHQKALELASRNGMLSGADTTVMELGTSACELLEHIKKNFNCRCIAADYPDAALEFAKSLGFETVHFDGNDAGSIPSDYDGIADVVISTATMEHITDVDATLAMVRRLLKPDGHFIMTVPNCSSYKHWLHYMYRTFPRDEGHHYRHFSWNNTLRLMLLNGFVKLDEEHEKDSRLPVKVLELIVNTLRTLTEPLARYLTSVGKLEYDIASHAHLQVINWGFLFKKDPDFIVTENRYINSDKFNAENARHSLERIERDLLGQKLIGKSEFQKIRSKLSRQ